MKRLVILLLFFMFFQASAQDWNQISDFPSTSRDDGTAFLIGDLAYFGTGITPWFAPLGNFYGLNLQNDTWFSIASLPSGKERQYASGFSGNQLGFVFGGYNGTNFLNDLWQFDPISNSWIEMTPIPAVGRSGAACFVLNDTAYIIGGKTANNSAIDDVWAYAILTDSWVQKNDLPNGNRWRASAATLNNNGYLIFGRDETNGFHNELLAYNQNSDLWSQISTFPYIGRSHAALLSVGEDLIVCFGGDSLNTYHNDLWSYSISLNTWHSLPDLPAEGRRGGMAIASNNGTIYYSTGLNSQNQRVKETWKYHESLDVIQIHENTNTKFVIKIIDVLGREVEAAPSTLQIYIYSDGSYEKVIQIQP